jgi:hypothetical protein
MIDPTVEWRAGDIDAYDREDGGGVEGGLDGVVSYCDA